MENLTVKNMNDLFGFLYNVSDLPFRENAFGDVNEHLHVKWVNFYEDSNSTAHAWMKLYGQLDSGNSKILTEWINNRKK